MGTFVLLQEKGDFQWNKLALIMINTYPCSLHIFRERFIQFGDKLYLEFGGKLFDDYHASRVLPGFAPDSKLQMLLQLADQAEMIISINASDIERNKIRHDLGITYDQDVLRLIDVYKKKGLYVSSVVITRYAGQPSANLFQKKLESHRYPGLSPLYYRWISQTISTRS